MIIKEVLDNLILLPNAKVNIIRQSRDELRQWQVRDVVEHLALSSDYAWFLSNYDEFGIINQDIDFYIGSLRHMSEQFALSEPNEDNNFMNDSSFKELIHSLHFAVIRLYESNQLSINVYFSFNLVAPTGIYYSIFITDFLSGAGKNDGKSTCVSFREDEVLYASDFTSFVSKIIKNITKQGLQELISMAGIDFEISKAGSYGHLREIISPPNDDGLPF